MTEQVSGSSLPQTQGLGQQHQEFNHQDLENQHRHTHVHFRNIETSHRRHQKHHHHHHHIRSQKEDNAPDKRDNPKSESEDVVIIVKTISVLQITDSTGSTFIQTLSHNTPPPTLIETPAEPTVAASNTKAVPTTGSSLESSYEVSTRSDSSGDGASDNSPSSTPSLADPTVTPPGSSMPASFPTLTYAPITSSHLSPTRVFPSLSSLSNATQALPSSISNSTASLHSFTTASEGNFTFFGSAVSSHHTTSTLSTGLSSTLTHASSRKPVSTSHSSVTYLISTVHPDVTQPNGDNGIGSPTGTVVGGGSVPTDTGFNSNNTSPGTIAGSVVGAISGLAFILLLAAALLRWKKRRASARLIQGSGSDGGYGAVATRGSAGPGGDGMSERRRSTPFAIPAALANLTGQGRFSKSIVSSDGGEKGFTKISGRKLPPVLQFGGDGYTDPRETMMSDQSIEYRASQQFFGEAPLSRLAVGSPMLPETSIPVFHESPARTAVATLGPFSDPFSDHNRVDSPPLPPDPVGRSHIPRDGSTRSHTSFSKFTEEL